MEIGESTQINGRGIFSTGCYKPGDIVHVLTGNIFTKPTRESIHIGNNKHIYDELGIFINHSFTPNVCIDSIEIKAISEIQVGDEITFNYNDSEINMATPFIVNGKTVSGKTV